MAGSDDVREREEREAAGLLADGVQERHLPRRNLGRAALSWALVAIMGVAMLDGVDAVNLVGVDETVVTASGEDASGRQVTLTVRYPAVTRPALASPFEITVQRQGGFDHQDVELAITTAYLTMWDLNGILPAPTEETADPTANHLSFEPPDGDTLVVTYEARIEPGVQESRAGEVSLLDADGAPLLSVDLHSTVRP